MINLLLSIIITQIHFVAKATITIYFKVLHNCIYSTMCFFLNFQYLYFGKGKIYISHLTIICISAYTEACDFLNAIQGAVSY